MSDNQQPIIIKKVKGHGHGHHGGAWKVAYADFVTAMMAFFLLLWLLNATTEEQTARHLQLFQPGLGLNQQQRFRRTVRRHRLPVRRQSVER